MTDKKLGESSCGKYGKLIGIENPALIVILVDQSGSMADNGKANWAAEAVNRTILEIVSSCRGGTKIKDRLFLGVIGYGDLVVPLVGGKISEIAGKCLGVDKIVSENLDLPIWVEPKAENGTPMAEAFRKAADLIRDWASGHQNSFPPIVINITDGPPDDFSEATGLANETQEAAEDLRQIQTGDGKLLLFNVHISGLSSPEQILFPNSTDGLPDSYAKLLFTMSSELPQRLLREAELAGINPRPGAKGFAYNVKAGTLIKLLAFGSSMSARTPEEMIPKQTGAVDMQRPEEIPLPTEAPKHIHDNAQFTVYRPKTVQPLRWYPLLAFAHLSEIPPDAPDNEPDPLVEVERQARRVLGQLVEDYRDLTQDSAQSIPHEGEITFVPKVEGIDFNPSRRSFRWQESVHREEFRLRARPELDGQTARGRVTVFLGVILVADISLSIKVDSGYRQPSESAPVEKIPSVSPYRKIFASYSRLDLEIVRQVALYVRAMGDRYLIDLTDLRAGEDWNEQLKVMIAQADIFQLFWSWNSMKSLIVKNEWEYALSLGRTNFVRPCFWEEPLPENRSSDLPPDDLKKLHFERLEIRPSSRGTLDLYHSSPSLRDSVPEPPAGPQCYPKMDDRPEKAKACPSSALRTLARRSLFRMASRPIAVLITGILIGGISYYTLLPQIYQSHPVEYRVRVTGEPQKQSATQPQIPDMSLPEFKPPDRVASSSYKAPVRSAPNGGKLKARVAELERERMRQMSEIIAREKVARTELDSRSRQTQGSAAASRVRKEAERGSATAQSALGDMYANGLGVGKDYREAVRWYRKAAEQGHARAQNQLGDMYREGNWLPQNYPEAIIWYLKSAQQGEPRAQYCLGTMYQDGLGVPKDSAEATKWFTKAAEQGFNPAKEELVKIQESASK